MEEKKMTQEEKIKLIDELIADEQEALDNYSKAIEKLKGSVCSKVLSMLGAIQHDEVAHLSMLEDTKNRIENGFIGCEEAEALFGFYR